MTASVGEAVPQLVETGHSTGRELLHGADLEYFVNRRRVSAGNRCRLLRDGDEAFPAMLEAIAGAQRQVLLETYIIHGDRSSLAFCAALAERARAGVAVYFMFDSVGSFDFPLDVIREMRQAGVHVLEYAPYAPWRPRWRINRRNHRKTCVVDGVTAFTGGINIGDENLPPSLGGGGWHDLHVRIDGPVAAECAHMFHEVWRRGGGDAFDLVLSGPSPAGPEGHAHAMVLGNHELRLRKEIRRAYLHAIDRARRSIAIMNAYFVPDRGIRRALARAVVRGVDVRILIPGPANDLRALYHATRAVCDELLANGVKIFEWPDRMMHAKTAAIDGAWVTVGSYNLDHRSLFHNLEANLICVDRALAAQVEASFRRDLARCDELELASWRRRSVLRKVGERFYYLFRHWL